MVRAVLGACCREAGIFNLIGAFILVAAVLMFFKATADMYDSWDNLKAFDSCIERVGACDPEPSGALWEVQDPCGADEWQSDYDNCRDQLREATGVVVRSGQTKLTGRQFWSALLAPIAAFFFWLAVMFVGWMLYSKGRFAHPMKGTFGGLRETQVQVKEKKKK